MSHTTPVRLPRAASLRPLALGGLALGAVLALVAGSRAWWRAAGTGVSVSFTGTEASGGLATALALVVLAGALLALVLRSRGRQVLGVLLLLTGAGAVVLGLLRPRPASPTVRSRVLEVSLADSFALDATPWPLVYAVAGLLVVLAAGAMALSAPRWASRVARFERPRDGDEDVIAASAARRSSADDPAALWRLLDAGVDPTAGDLEADAEGDAGHSLQPSDGVPTKSPRTPAGPASALSPDPSGRAGVDEPPSGVTMKPRTDARTDEPT